MFDFLKRKRKQCLNCRKTFYKPAQAFHAKEGYKIDITVFEASPCCLASYVIV